MDSNTNEFSLLLVLNELKDEFEQQGKMIETIINVAKVSFSIEQGKNRKNILTTGLSSTIGDKDKIKLELKDMFEKIFNNIPKEQQQLIKITLDYFQSVKDCIENTNNYLLFIQISTDGIIQNQIVEIINSLSLESFDNHISYTVTENTECLIIWLPFNYPIQCSIGKEYVHDKEFLNKLRAEAHKS